MRLLQVFAIFLLSFGFAGAVQAQLAPVAPSVASGPYVVSFTSTPGAIITVLQESSDGGSSWVAIGNATQNNSVSVTHETGTYLYRVMALIGTFPDNLNQVYSTVVSVTVVLGDPPEVDEFEIQMGYQFVIRSGDVNNDGRQDLFVERTNGDLDNGTLSEAIILRQADGSFARLSPSQSQLDAARLWPTIVVETQIGDFNFDEVGDLVIGGIPGVDNMQILLSSGDYYDRNAAAVIDVNEDRLQYLQDLAHWIVDDTHFDDAVMPDVPGYNIKIKYRITQCFRIFGFPVCFSTDLTVVDIDVSLPDLGLDDYLNVQSKVSPGGMSAKAVGQYYSSTVHNVASAQLAQDNISTLIGTASQQSLALTTLADALPNPAPPDVLVCVIYCGYSISFFFDSYTIVSWVDIWTPITIQGAFDDENYSSEAHEVSVILDGAQNGGADFGTQEQWEAVAAINAEVYAVANPPFPGTNDRPKVKLGPLGRFFVGLWVLNEVYHRIDVIIEKIRWSYHYTGPLGTAGISTTGTIISGSGIIFVSPMVYSTGQQADQLLALCGELVTRRFTVRIPPEVPAIILPVLPKTCPPGTLQAGAMKLGTGPEQKIPSPAQVLPPQTGINVPR